MNFKFEINDEALLAAGYTKFLPGPCKDSARCLFEKVVWEGRLRLYSIHFYIYPVPGHGEVPGVEVALYREDGVTFQLERHLNEQDTVEMVEAFYASAYTRMNCCPDKAN